MRACIRIALIFAAALTSIALSADTPDWRAEVEADWARHDASRMQQLQQPSTLRLPSGVIEWPGLATQGDPAVPETDAPTLDGNLDDACWQEAIKLDPPTRGDPTYWMCHDGALLYVAASIPKALEWRFRGPLTAADAGGAVDGVKNGLYAFHTGGDKHPWWQVDLGAKQSIGRIVVYNRRDYAPGLHNADHLLFLASDDGENWTQVHENRKHFGGTSGPPPLEVAFDDLHARFIRLQVGVDHPILYHLDEVEIYSADDPEKNIALKRPATQSSLSQWSRGGALGASHMNVAGARMGITATDPPRVTLHDRPVGYSGVARTDDAMTVEWALRLQDIGHLAAGEVFLAGNVRAPVRVGGRWEVVWPENPTFGYGANTLEFEVTAPAGFDAPLDVSVETIVLTPTALERGAAGGTVLSQPGKASVTFTVASEGPAAAIITMRQGASEYKSGRVFYVPPVRETILRGQALHRDLSARSTSSFRELRQRVTDLEDTETRDGPQPDQRAKLHLEARWMVRDLALSNPALGDRGLLFVKRHTQQTYPDVCLNHMPWVSRPGGDICILSPIAPDGTVTPLIQGRLGPGHVHGMDLSPDGRRIVFAFAQTETNEPVQDWLVRNLAYVLRNREEPIHLFEMNSDGSDLRQLTDGEWSDLDPAYMPDGDVAFVSERCGYSLQCNENDKDETSTNLYAVTPGSGDVRRLTVSKDGDYIPHMLDNGMLAYTRWEYQERSFAHIQSVWIVAPDGTGADALYKQHMNDPWALEEMRSIPDSHKISAVATGHHTLPAGPVVIIDHHVGMNDPAGLGIVTPGSLPPEGGMTGLAVPEGGVQGVGGQYMSPWPLTEKHFLTSYTYGPETDENGYALYLIDVHGTRELVYNDPDISCSIPIPLAPRRKPMQVASIREPGAEDATCIVTDIYQGVEGIERGDIKYLRIAHRLPWPYDNERGGLRYEPDIKQVQVNWTPVAILGDVPVEEDGSAYFRVPTDIPVYFQALDENRMELQRMRSFINFQKGEMRSCSGCHETRGEAPVNPGTTTALQRGPSEYIPAPWGDKAVSFLRDVQPILDRNCVSCHDGLEPAGDLDLSGGLLATYNRAYQTINLAKLVSRSNIMEDARVTKPLMFGSHRSRLVEILATTHADRVKLTEDEHLGLVMWIDGNAPYDATFINNRQDVKPYNLAADADLRTQITEVHGRRCASCHAPEQVTRMDWIDLKRPAESRFLKAPLSICGDGAYADATDEDYQALLSAVTQAVQTAWERPRRDVATLDRRASERIAGR